MQATIGSTPSSSQDKAAQLDPLQGRFFLSPAEKASKEKGHAIVKAFYTQQAGASDSMNFFSGRQKKFKDLMLWAKGSQEMTEFLEFVNIFPKVVQGQANKAYVKPDMTQSRQGAKFVGTMVESYAKVRLYPVVKAIDSGSLSEKEDRELDAIYRMREIQQIDTLQKESGLQLEPSGVYIPEDEMAAKVYFSLEDRLPKEIRFEQLLKYTQSQIKFDEEANPRTLRNLIVTNIAATTIEKCGNDYVPVICEPQDMVYNFIKNDSSEWQVSTVGRFYALKVRDFRQKFGKTTERPDGMTEQEIFDLAKQSTSKSGGTFPHYWNDEWSNSLGNRPYDDFNILVLDCCIDFGEDEYAVVKTDKYGREEVSIKKGIPYQTAKKDGTVISQPKPDGVRIIKKSKNTWMRGVYAPYQDKLLYWGRPDLIIPQYTDSSKALCPYTIVIPGNDGKYVPSLFERIMEPLKEYQTVKLKRKILIGGLRRSGVKVDVESARNIDLGGGDSIDWEELVRIHDQTGNEIWSSKGIDSLAPASPAISPGTPDNDIQKIIGLTTVLQGIVQEIREIFGMPLTRDGGDMGERASGKMIDASSSNAFTVTDFIARANKSLWKETFYKICLLKWNDIVKEEPESKNDLLNTRFDLDIAWKMTEEEKQLLEMDIQRYSQVVDASGNPALGPKDAMMLRNIDNYKLACYYLVTTIEGNKRTAQQNSLALQKANGEEQRASAQQAAEMAAEQEDKRMAAEKEMEEFKGRIEKEKLLLQGFLAVCAKDETGNLIKTFMPAIQQLVPNIALPLAQENQEMQQKAAAEQQQQMLQQLMAQQQMQQQGPQEEAMEPQQEAPQQEMAEQPQMT